MKFRFHREALLLDIKYASRATATKGTTPILNSILIEANDDMVTIASTDYKTYYKSSFPADIESNGRVVVSAKKLIEALKAFPEDSEVWISSDIKHVLRITSDLDYISTEFKIYGVSPDEFPPIPSWEKEEYFEMDASDLEDAINRTIYAISKEESRTYLAGVYFLKTESTLELVGTDGLRMAYYKYDLPDAGTQEDFGAVIPEKTLRTLLEVLKIADSVTISFDSETERISFKIGNTTIISGIIDTSFPDFRSVIPSSCEVRGLIVKDEFLKVLKALLPFTNPDTKAIILKIKDTEIVLEASAEGVGEAKDVIAITAKEGKDMDIPFNIKHLIDATTYLSGEATFIELCAMAPTRPVRFRIEDDDQQLAVIMPTRIE